MARKSSKVATGNIDAQGNIGINLQTLSGNARRVPLQTATLNVDANGNLGVFLADSSGGGGSAEVGNLIQGTGIILETVGDKIRISIDPSVVDTTQETSLTQQEVENILTSTGIK
jgi:hypothetical protein